MTIRLAATNLAAVRTLAGLEYGALRIASAGGLLEAGADTRWALDVARNVPKLDRRIPYDKPRDFGTIQ